VRNSLPVEPSRADNDGDSSVAPQSRIGAACRSSGRRASMTAAKPARRGPVERHRVRMPERVTIRGVGSPPAESPRVPGEGQSAQGQSGPKARPRGAADGQRANIPAPDGEVDGRRRRDQADRGDRRPRPARATALRSGSPPQSRPRKALSGRPVGPYRKPTQVGQASIRRRSGEPS
jgi:hypothetical protein